MANDKIRLFSRLASTIPMATVVEIMSLSTSVTGTNYVAFADKECDALDIVNHSNQNIVYVRNGTGDAMVILSKTSRIVVGISNASEISIRREDLNATPVTVSAEAMTL